MKRVVLDTNVIVSALLLKGRLAALVDQWKAGKIIPVVSKDTFRELKAVLSYPKFALRDYEMQSIIENEILPFFEVIELKEKVRGVCRDPHDDKFLSVAVSAKVAWIVTGDKDLLELRTYKSVKIVTPKEHFMLVKP
jgi:putative PIN family toxin of toxin-antitoxin system